MAFIERELPVSIREQQKAETRSRVIEAARALFGEVGYEAATIREIARRAGVAPGSVFTTFASKTDLLQEIIFIRYAEMVDDVRAAARTGAGVRARLEAGARKAYELELQERRLICETIGASWTWPLQAERENRKRLAPLFSVIVDTLREGARAGELKPYFAPELLADAIFAMYLRNFRFAQFDDWSAAQLGDHFARQLQALFEGAGA